MEDLTPYRTKAVMALTGVGSATHGEWWEDPPPPEAVAVHLRRRLSPEEQVEFGVYVRDIRGSVEHIERAYEVASRTGYPHHELLAFEMPG